MNELRVHFEEKAAAYLQLKNKLLKKHKIAKKELQALQYLALAVEPIRVGSLTEPLEVTHSRVTRVMDYLVQQKLATRTTSKHDRRCWLALITAKGIELVTSYNRDLDIFFEVDGTIK